MSKQEPQRRHGSSDSVSCNSSQVLHLLEGLAESPPSLATCTLAFGLQQKTTFIAANLSAWNLSWHVVEASRKRFP